MTTLRQLVGGFCGPIVGGRHDGLVKMSLAERTLSRGASQTGEPRAGQIRLSQILQREKGLRGPSAEAAVELMIDPLATHGRVGVQR